MGENGRICEWMGKQADCHPIAIFVHVIKIIHCVEGAISDCQLEASSIVKSWRLRAMVIVKG